jgi:cytochrome c
MEIFSMRFRLMLGKLTPARLIGMALGAGSMSVVVLLAVSSALAVQDAKTGDAAHGRELFERRCTGCHSLDNDKEGPRLRGVYGRKSGSISSFKYSDALMKAGVTWDETSLDKWLADPDKFISDVDMDFHLEKADERTDVIAYLKQLSSK